MKKNLKCLTALCMAGAMISLTGCGSSSQSTSADTTAGSASSEATSKERTSKEGTSVTSPVMKIVIIYFSVNVTYVSAVAAQIGNFFGTYAAYA